ncbi:YitT family protein [Spiroplasma endosymbiont of Anurida maritima]|uniref:YitT family protein n=1 Tax=Spiroplasma endosymbiont of Anurida maritima TaxID=2967972 RepID=UPI0036D24331
MIVNKTMDIYQKASKQGSRKRKITLDEFNFRFKAYFRQRLFRDYMYIILASLIATIAYDYVIAQTTSNGIFPAGVSAIARAMSIWFFKSSSDAAFQNTMYWLFFLIFNLPLFIFSVIKVSWRFSFRTIVFIITQNIFHFMFQYIPFINPNSLSLLINFKSLILYQNSSGNYQIWLFAFSALSAVLNGIAFALLYKAAASTGGTDFVVAYFSEKRNMSIAALNRVVNYILAIVIILLHTILLSPEEVTTIFFGTNWQKNFEAIVENNPDLLIDKNSGLYGASLAKYKVEFFFGPSMFATLMLIIIQSIVTDVFFPRYKYRSLMVITTKPNEIIHSLEYIKYQNDIIRIPIVDRVGNTEINKEMLIFSSSLLEFKKVKAAIMITDKESKILTHKLDKLIGNYTPTIEY